MRREHWWVEPRLLTSGDDPTPSLSTAANQFADDFVPMVFMTGDGHRHPPFRWTTRGPWPAFFDEVVRANKLCCHVETYSDQVTAESVPANLLPVFNHHKVFGWEPDVFRIIQVILEDIMDLLPNMLTGIPQPKTSIRRLVSDMWRVHDHGFLRAEGAAAVRFGDLARASVVDPVPVATLPGFTQFLRDYNLNAMQLRTTINNVIGANIQRNILLYPDHMHLITCGDAHIIHNPLYLYVRPPVGTFGVVDQESG